MAGQKNEEQILAALELGAAEQGVDIVAVEISGPASHPTLRVRLDVEDGTADMERIAAATPWVSGVVEELDPFPGSYELEVSSPGLDRPLRRAKDFVRFVGETVDVRLAREVDGLRSVSGALVAADEEGFEVEGHRFAYEDLKSAKIKPDFEKIMAEAKRAAKLVEEQGEDFDDEDSEEEPADEE